MLCKADLHVVVLLLSGLGLIDGFSIELSLEVYVLRLVALPFALRGICPLSISGNSTP